MNDPQPQWFYSSLAQVTAAIVGFVGGFLLLRILELMRGWQDLAERLKTRQADWARAEFEERQHDQIHPPRTGPYTGERLRLANAESRAWDDFYRAVQDQRLARLPRELLAALGAVVVIALGFALGPLLALKDPSTEVRWKWVGALAALLVLIALLIGISVIRAFRSLRDFKFWPRVQARLDEHAEGIDAMQQREEAERREREGKEGTGE